MLGCINPYGIKIYNYAFYMTGADIAEYVADWIPYSVPGVAGAIVLVLMLISIFFGNFELKKLNELDIVSYVLVFMWLIATLKYGRCINVFMYIFFLLGSQWAASFIRFILNKIAGYYKRVFDVFIMISVVVFGMILCIGFYQIKGIFVQSVRDRNEQYVTRDMAEYLKDEDRIIFNDEKIGGWLIYNDIKVFCDGRLDLYINGYNDNDIAIEAMAALYTPDIMTKISDKYNINTLVLANNTVYSELYSACDGWLKVMENEEIVIFKKHT